MLSEIILHMTYILSSVLKYVLQTRMCSIWVSLRITYILLLLDQVLYKISIRSSGSRVLFNYILIDFLPAKYQIMIIDP